jgi:chlorobactene glucosyltransferase
MALLTILGIAIVNALTFPRLHPVKPKPPPIVYPPVGGPRVSVLIPARDEAGVIAQTVRSLLEQDYHPLEVIVLDDDSQDGTGDIAQSAARTTAGVDPRLRVIRGAPLLPGWLGKNWACHQLAQSATGDILIFADADVEWKPGSVAALVEMLIHAKADLLTVWSTQITKTWGERLVVPLMALVIMGYLSVWLVNKTSWTPFAAANGQCLAFRRKAYAAVGGHVAVRDQIIEDIQLARRIKAKGMRLWMADGAGMIACRMYRDWGSVRNGYAKNILAGYGGRVSFLALATLFHWLIFLFPVAWLIFGWALPHDGGYPPYPAYPLALIVLGIGIRALTAAATRQRVVDAIFMPISVVLMTVIAAQAVYWQWRYGGAKWKGRVIKKETT